MCRLKARKRPIDVLAYRYSHNTIVSEFLDLLSSNKDEPVRFDELDGTIYIQKARGEIAIPKGNWVIEEINTDSRFWSIDPEIFHKTYEKISGSVYSYRKKVYEVDCIELSSLEDEDILSVLEFMGYVPNGDIFKNLHRDELIEDCKKKGYLPIRTLEGVEALYPTEILIKGVNGEFYPVSRENFDKVYDLIEETTSEFDSLGQNTVNKENCDSLY